MEQSKIEELIKEKVKIKRRYKGQIIYFSVGFSILSFLLMSSFLGKIHAIVLLILLVLMSILIPAAFSVVLCGFVKKEKHLKLVNFFLCSNQYVLNFLFLTAIYFQYYFKDSKLKDANSVISFYSISWAIFGIAITLFGIWLSVNSKHLKTSEESEGFFKNNIKYNAIIGAIFTFVSILINLSILLSGVSYISSGTFTDHSSYYIGIIYISSYSILNMLTFLFFPTILELADGSNRFNKSLLEYYDETIKLIETTQTINETITLLNKIIDSINNTNTEKTKK